MTPSANRSSTLALQVLVAVVFLQCFAYRGFGEHENANPLLGRWLVLRVGDTETAKLPFTIEWEFTKSEVIVRNITNSEEMSRSKHDIDVSKEPKWITIAIVDQAKEIRKGIFKITGDELHLKQAVGGDARPTSFPTNAFMILKLQSN